MKRFLLCLMTALFVASSTSARADEGMWTFDRFPSKAVGAKYGFTPSQAWLDHVRLASVRIAGGCSASFVSSRGLIMTNHHCVEECVNGLSTASKNYVEDGFYAKTDDEEKACPGFEIDQLTSITDVTKAVTGATAGKTGAALTAAIRAENAKLQKACATETSIRCDVVSLYHGGVYNLYKYHRYRDIRLVFAPEFAVAQFGGDPDNFNFPRFNFDVSFLRAYDGGKPAATPDHLKWNAKGTKAGDLVFVAGNPGSTQRQLTMSQLGYLRNVALPRRVTTLAENRGRFDQYSSEGTEQQRTAKDTLFYGENGYKVFWGQLQALNDETFSANLAKRERDLRAKVAENQQLTKTYGVAWSRLESIQAKKSALAITYQFKTGGGLATQYFSLAQTLVRLPVEKAKANAERLPEFSDSALVTLPDDILDPTPIYPGLEETKLALSLDRVRREFGPDDAFVKTVLADKSPADRAHDLVTKTKLGDVAYRKTLLDGGEAAIRTSDDPFIKLALEIDDQARALRKQYEEEVANPERQLSEFVARAQFAVYGTSIYPDATFSPRLNYGAVAGFTDDHGVIAPYTTVGGLFARANGADPYVLPPSWLAAKSKLDLSTPMNVSTTNDIIGGNSGSPLIDKDGQVVGLIFDGNIHSIGGAFGYDSRLNRAIAVDARAIVSALGAVYHAERVVTEIDPR
jgi:hypothetical protein